MTQTKFNWVYRSGSGAGSPVPSFFTCATLGEITGVTAGDIAYNQTTKEFWRYDGSGWMQFSGGTDLEARVTLLEFFVDILLNITGVA